MIFTRTIAARAQNILALLFILPAILVNASAFADDTQLAESLEATLTERFNGDFEAILERGYLRVLIPFSKTGFFIDKGVQRGSSVDLMTELGKHLDELHGKKVADFEIVLIPTPREKLFSNLADGRGDMAVGNLTITEERRKLVSFSTPLLKDVHEVPVTLDSEPELTAPKDLSGRKIYVRKSASYHQSLEALNRKWARDGTKTMQIALADDRFEDEDILEMVAAGTVPMTIVDQHKAELWLEVLEGLKLHPKAAIRTDGEIAIAVRSDAPALLAEINGFAATVKKGTLLGNLIFKKYLQEADYLRNMRDESYQADLEKFTKLFERYGEEYKFDWLLIAAQSFQESRFDPKAHSRAGAVGLMQIKPSTAEGDPINIRGIAADTDKNVHAGVKYLRHIADQYFADLAGDQADQTFFALAAYNAGPSRFEKLRKQAEKQGYDPDKWFGNVEWIVAAKIGRQPIEYVGNIYQYYVVFHNIRKHQEAGAAAEKATATK
ncbi:membrane-bound lytic murein transglycosylase MltF [Labrenzia sp. EL_159]|nr:membrane-bound lytic murein transglycosylase MltF [Labrenzia sp. EL_162]MBG6196890.1 membrane-bound lytic murein transglycosylase MltF [Labrenzia sp. EL_159]